MIRIDGQNIIIDYVPTKQMRAKFLAKLPGPNYFNSAVKNANIFKSNWTILH